MFETSTETVQANQAIKYKLDLDGARLSFVQVVQLWIDDSTFRMEFTRVLAEAPFAAFRWETPAVSRSSVDQPFEFVLLNASSFESRQSDSRAFQEHFATDEDDHGVVTFKNLPGDATLVAPCPQTDLDVYGHLASFVRGAPETQIDEFWRRVGETVQTALRASEQPIWLSTAGGGVAWLHVRLDSRPKYYGHGPYKSRP